MSNFPTPEFEPATSNLDVTTVDTNPATGALDATTVDHAESTGNLSTTSTEAEQVEDEAPEQTDNGVKDDDPAQDVSQDPAPVEGSPTEGTE